MSLDGNGEQVHQVFLERIAIPHAEVDATSSAYSTYCTANCPEEYEARMVQLTTASRDAKFKWSGEKRYHKTREDLEAALDYETYIGWETDARAKNPDSELARGVFERAIATAAKAAEADPAYKYFEVGLWERYAVWSGDDNVRLRAVRACPGSGATWAKCPDVDVELVISMGELKQPVDIAELFVARAAAASRAGELEAVVGLVGQGFGLMSE